MSRRSTSFVCALGLLAPVLAGCGASQENLFGGKAKDTLRDAAATGGASSGGGVGGFDFPDASTAPPGAGGATGTDGEAPNGDANAEPDGSAGQGATDGSLHCTPSRLYLDGDGDGFGDAAHAIEGCPAPHYVKDAGDCYDANAKAYPGQTESFDVDRGDGSFDYDCDGAGIPDLTTVGKCGSVPFCAGSPGWRASAPECGHGGTWLLTCTGLTTICGQTTEPRIQKCR